MSDKWPKVALAALSSEVSYGYTESASLDRVGPKFLRITDIQGGRVSWESVPYCKIQPAEHRRYRLHSGDIVIARTGNSTGENYCFVESEDAVFASYLIRFRIDPKRAHSRFVYYNLRGSGWWDYVKGAKTGSAQAGANAQVLGAYSISLPPLPEQRAIAHILGTLDDKIELNRRMCATLEEMARALFKSWFVDFDPVRAKMEGRETGLPKEIADLFPSRLVDSELGPIPEGWGVQVFADVLALSRQPVDPQEHPAERFAHYSIPAFDVGMRAAIELGAEIKSQKLLVSDIHVLVSKLNPRTPRVWLPPADGGARQIASTEFLVCEPVKSSGYTRLHVYHAAISSRTIEYLASNASGTSNSHQRVRPQDFLSYSFPAAGKAVLVAFDCLVAPLHAKIALVREEAHSLAALRDTLLPKLISGELRVPTSLGSMQEIAT